MKKVLLFLTLFFLVSTSVPVSSLSAEAMVKLPGSVTVDGINLRFGDLSIDGKLMVDVYVDGSHYRSLTLSPGENVSINDLKFKYEGAYIGSESFAVISLQYSYLLAGDKLVIGDYRFRVLSVDQKGFKINATYKGESKIFTQSSFKIGHLQVKVNSTPNVFDGILNPGENVTVGDHYVKLVKIWASKSGEKVVSGAVFEIDGNSYTLESGKSQTVGSFVVDLKSATIVGELGEEDCDNCKGYAEVSINLLAVSIDAETVPDAQIKLSPGQTASVGPYILRYDYPLGDAVKASLLNNCGQKLAEGRLRLGEISYVLAYPGAIIGLESISDESAEFIVFLDPSEFPDVTKTANLLMSLEVKDTKIKQYVPFDVVLRVKNTGSVALKNALITFEPSKGLKLVSDNTVSIDSIAPGKEAAFTFKVVPIQNGTVELGKAYATVLAPFELACGQCTILTFTSNTANVTVEPSTIKYNVSPTGPESVPVGTPFNLSITVENKGDVSIPANLSIRIPPGVGVELSKDMALKDGAVVVPLSLGPGDKETLVLELVPSSPGNYSITALVETPYGEYSPVKFFFTVISSKTTVITKTEHVTETVSPVETSQGNKTTVTATITNVTTTTEYKTETTTSTVEVPYTPLTTKLLWFGVGVAIGVGVIIGIAWYMSRSS
ncbi:hypothetical membrane protein, conserved [Thermococcus kodakarensis KOD1]|uniref:Hypothetical membrane protein, conserved n=1 Tax=Thermococcus kodakarensis (strain ATCC BAA-918 / JCM 12380 / KOD1) TaxID=69014 RepID=Q5JEE2_THEKO|nr:hypothetical protein [Thermococcus kodakarensis]WCN28166.1 hypothetical protein POG15_00265 [Thermococcus kodakarensis]WCN30464.1 hypothetical protein POG21_00265 [Thermococcus kodakarensis]BAD84239.1 hypothetical membrane protein, conserved [Thermococcus kodakarensis KOD1]